MCPVDFESLAGSAFDEIKCTLGIDVLYLPKAGGQIQIRGVWDDRAQQVDPDIEKVVSSNIYTLGVKLTDLPFLPAKGDRAIIKNKTYKVIDSLEDGVEGVSTFLLLHRVD